MFQGVILGFGINGTGVPLMTDSAGGIWWFRGDDMCFSKCRFLSVLLCSGKGLEHRKLDFQHCEEAGHLHAESVCLSEKVQTVFLTSACPVLLHSSAYLHYILLL